MYQPSPQHVGPSGLKAHPSKLKAQDRALGHGSTPRPTCNLCVGRWLLRSTQVHVQVKDAGLLVERQASALRTSP